MQRAKMESTPGWSGDFHHRHLVEQQKEVHEIKTHGSESCGQVECVTTTVSYLREQLTLIFLREIQANKSSFLKITACY